MGAKGLWRHVEGTAVAPKPYTVKDGVHLLADLKTQATDEQVEAKESKNDRVRKTGILSSTYTTLNHLDPSRC